LKIQWLIFIVVVLVSACSTHPVREENKVDPKQRSQFEAALRSFEEKKFEKAAGQFNDFLNVYPNSRFYSAAHYNLGLALENLNRCPEAIPHYETVVELNKGAESRDGAEALYRMSICYELMGSDDKTLFTLLELDKFKSGLSKETLETEIPARLATAYARVGNEELARQYYNRAASGLKRLRRQALTGDLPVWLPKTLYHMGIVSLTKRESNTVDFHLYMAPLDTAQTWLLRAAETGNNEWATKAKNDLIRLYQEAQDAIDKVPLDNDTDHLAALEKQQRLQRSMSAEIISVAEHLKLERIPKDPDVPENPNVAEIFEILDQVSERAKAYIHAKDVRDNLTPEAQDREDLKGEGRIVEPTPIPKIKKKKFGKPAFPVEKRPKPLQPAMSPVP